jgi:hypothetical protein
MFIMSPRKVLLTSCLLICLGSVGSPQAVASTTSGRTAATRVRLVSCPSTYGAYTGAPKKHQTSELISLPKNLVGHVSLYSNSTKVFPAVVGPVGWSCRFLYSGDGTVLMQIYPRSERVVGSGWWTKPQPPVSLESEAIFGSEQTMLDTLCPLTTRAIQELNATGLKCPPPTGSAIVTGSVSQKIAGMDLGLKFESRNSAGTLSGFVVLRTTAGGHEVVTGSCTVKKQLRQRCGQYLTELLSRYWEL